MLPGTNKSIVLPDDFVPPPPGFVDFNLASYLLLKFGKLNQCSPDKIRDMNQNLLNLEVCRIWNGCNGCPIDSHCELSLDATPRNYSFVNFVTKTGIRSRPHYVPVVRYFEEKYKVVLQFLHSPLLRDPTGRMFPVEAVWFRLRVF
ncbi:hypothetical protein GCK72_013060 [Caenorhabditis remanei]|uniref:Uncharacterized protein n=1 Tax=Caenorhabditis remanei TaxID=31234 RepID=E3NE27_CAERE|nr:hypothetical protein GCK72_013060 [Caenorhabditis remanei]EFO94262.1 hypothetical protein CRE_30171 [Caenorhabditis remanei]KAF1756607.1 hypothetical protein GCK72_013060 [Caenorhabditis remanei]